MEEVARVEVLTGLSGFLYSAGNVGGIVNSITIGNTGGQNMCAVCLERPATHAFVPCFHLCVCEQDGQTILNADKKCPICRASSSSLQAVYQAGVPADQ